VEPGANAMPLMGIECSSAFGERAKGRYGRRVACPLRLLEVDGGVNWGRWTLPERGSGVAQTHV
jgi:hypothetical protein